MESRLGSNIDSQIWEKRDQDQRLRLKTDLNRDANLADRVSRCGNGIRESGEECDGRDLGSHTCMSVEAGQ
jgi:hypothetical protein